MTLLRVLHGFMVWRPSSLSTYKWPPINLLPGELLLLQEDGTYLRADGVLVESAAGSESDLKWGRVEKV